MEPNQQGIDGGSQCSAQQQSGGQQQGDAQQQGGNQQQVGVEQLSGVLQGGLTTLQTKPTSDDALPPDQPKQRQPVQVRVLVDCEHGRPNDVVELSATAARTAARSGQVDLHPDSVAYALSLKK